MFGERRTIVHFRVAGYWKGDVSQTITLHTIDNQVSCSGYDFKKGQQYLVYGSRAKAMYWLGYGDRRPELQGVTYPKSDDEIFGTSICSRTGPLSAARDIAELGSPKIPQ